MGCIAPRVPFGKLSRTCLDSGNWSEPSLVCRLPDPCVLSPCQGESKCITAPAADLGYYCQCINGATGVATDDGSGCITPSIYTTDGNIQLSVSGLDDVKFSIGSSNYSVLTLENQIDTIRKDGGTIDVKLSVALSTLSVAIDADLSSAQAATSTSLSTAIAKQLPITTQAVADDAQTKTANALTTALADSSSKVQTATNTANTATTTDVSTARSVLLAQASSADSTMLSASAQYTDAMRSTLTVQINGKKCV
jgi:hypothetical protein